LSAIDERNKILQACKSIVSMCAPQYLLQATPVAKLHVAVIRSIPCKICCIWRAC